MSSIQNAITRGWLYRPRSRGGKSSPRWSLDALYGRWVELSGRGCATLSAVAQLLGQAQGQGAPVAWLRLAEQSFYPPDFAAWGLELSTMPVVRVPNLRASARACEHLLRSGAFAVVVMDLVAMEPHRLRNALAMPLQGRLLRLAQRRHVLLLSLTRSSRHQGSLGTMISLRAEVKGHFVPSKHAGLRDYIYKIEVLKDKVHGPGWCFEQRIKGRLAELVPYSKPASGGN